MRSLRALLRAAAYSFSMISRRLFHSRTDSFLSRRLISRCLLSASFSSSSARMSLFSATHSASASCWEVWWKREAALDR